MVRHRYEPGVKFGKLTLVERLGMGKWGQSLGLFRCDCGGEKETYIKYVSKGDTQSCGCESRAHKRKSHPGDRRGKLVLIRWTRKGRALFRCDCGTEKEIPVKGVRNGTTVSCGCHGREARRRSITTHGLLLDGMHPLYSTWSSMHSRCRNRDAPDYHKYGGRGIYVCERWRDFAAFVADMGPKPSRKHSIDRIDNDGPYSPENCRWATDHVQANNTRRNRRYEWNGKNMTATQLSAVSGISAYTIRGRIQRGWSVERAVSEPVRRHG